MTDPVQMPPGAVAEVTMDTDAAAAAAPDNPEVAAGDDPVDHAEHIGDPVDPAELDPATLAHLAEHEADMDGDGQPDPPLAA